LVGAASPTGFVGAGCASALEPPEAVESFVGRVEVDWGFVNAEQSLQLACGRCSQRLATRSGGGAERSGLLAKWRRAELGELRSAPARASCSRS